MAKRLGKENSNSALKTSSGRGGTEWRGESKVVRYGDIDINPVARLHRGNPCFCHGYNMGVFDMVNVLTAMTAQMATMLNEQLLADWTHGIEKLKLVIAHAMEES